MPLTLRQLLETARAEVESISVEDAQEMMTEGALLLDVRDAPELEANGHASVVHHIPRGMLEFRADPESPFHDPVMQPDRPMILYCASGARSVLAAKLLKDMGFEKVYNLGGFNEWKEGGGPVTGPFDRGMDIDQGM